MMFQGNGRCGSRASAYDVGVTEPPFDHGSVAQANPATAVTDGGALGASNATHAEAPIPMQRLHPSVRITWLIDTAITTVFMFGGMTAIDLLGLRKWEAYPLPPMVGAGLMLIAWIGLMIYYNIRRYACWGYAIRPLDVLIEHGVWWKSRRCIPRSRIQHVDIRSGPIDRSLGLANVSLFVAGGVGAVAEISGVDPLEAERLRSALVEQDSAVNPAAITPQVLTAAPIHQTQAPMNQTQAPIHQTQQGQGWQGGHGY